MSDHKSHNEIEFPPQSLEQLILIVRELKSANLDLPIGRKTLTALNTMVDNPEQTALSNIVELADWLSISPASITRLAKLLGFSGFNPMQSLFKRAGYEPIHFYSDNLEALINEGKEADSFFQKRAILFSNILLETSEQIDNALWEKAAQLIAKQKRVFVFGYRQPSAIASIFRYGLTLLRSNVYSLSQTDHGTALEMSQLRFNDLLVVISATPYSSATLKVAKYARGKQCKIIAITDTENSPFLEFADIGLLVPTVNQFYVNSQVLNCFFVENLLNMVATKMGSSALESVRQYETLLNEFKINQ